METYRYSVLFQSAGEGGFVVTVPVLPGLVTEGDTFEEAREKAAEAILCHLESLKSRGIEIPVQPEGRAVLVDHVTVEVAEEITK